MLGQSRSWRIPMVSHIISTVLMIGPSGLYLKSVNCRTWRAPRLTLSLPTTLNNYAFHSLAVIVCSCCKCSSPSCIPRPRSWADHVHRFDYQLRWRKGHFEVGQTLTLEGLLRHLNISYWSWLTIHSIDYINLTPDPPVKGQPLDIEFKGWLKEQVEEGSYIDLTVKVRTRKVRVRLSRTMS